MFILDFDDTLFDTHAFKQARREAILSLGISDSLDKSTYQKARKSSDGLWSYSNKRHAQFLADKGFDKEEILQIFQKVTDESVQFLFSGVQEFLEKIQECKQSIVLLSYGDPTFQKEKIDSVGIAHFFDKLMLISDSKIVELHKLMNTIHEKFVWFINDKVEESKEIATEFPDFQMVMKISPKYLIEDYTACGFPSFVTFKEIGTYVTSK